MPIYESYCAACQRTKEWYAPLSTSPDPACELCHGPTTRLISGFNVVFTGPLTARYNDPQAENPHQEGFWAHRVKSSSSGQPEPCFIETWQQRKQYLKDEGLVGGEEVGPVDGTGDGKWSTTRTGRPGTWV